MVEPWLQSHVSQLVTAMGASTKNGYSLGDEAQGCLSDLKKWLINYDTKMSKWDVARAIANTTLVDGDLLVMIHTHASNPEQVPFKPALNALEIVTHLTWPLEPDHTNVNHMDHLKGLRDAQLRYKRTALGLGSLFKAVIKLTVPSIQKPSIERSSKDNGIVRLCLNFVRNMLAIEQDRSELLVVLNDQKMLDFLVLLISNQELISAEEALPFLEVTWGLVSNVDPVKLFKGSAEYASQDRSLGDLLAKEKKMKESRFRPTRHSRFGTMISLDMGDNALPVSGQQALSTNYFDAIDKSKTWHKANPAGRAGKEKYQWNVQVSLSPQGQEALKEFVAKFLDSAYNPFFTGTRSFVSGLADDFTPEQVMHYVFLVGWFANAERSRGKIDFKLIGTALSYQMFTLVCDIMANAHDSGPGQSFDLTFACMVCLRSIFMAIDDMTRSSSEWKDAAQNILARLFYDDQRLDLFARLPRSANKRTVAYRQETIELVHSLFKLLDYYASDKAYLFVKSRRARDPDYDGDAERAQSRVKDRKWDLTRYIRSFYHHDTLKLYEKAVDNFEESDDKILKHCLAFYSRLFIKKELRAQFYQLSFMMALQRATSTTRGIQNPELLKQYTKFTNFYTKMLFQAFEEHPSLYCEILFNKSKQDVDYYDLGVVDKSAKTPKAASYDYELPEDMSRERKIAVTVAALAEDNRKPIVEWVLETLKAFVESNSKVRIFCESPGRLREIDSIPLLRLLLKTIGLKLDKGRYFIPTSLDSFSIIEACEWIQKYLNEQLDEDPHNHLKRRINEEQVAEEDDELFVPRPAGAESDSEPEEDGFNDPRLQPLSAEELAARELSKGPPVGFSKQRARKFRKRAMESESDESGSDSELEDDEDDAPKKKPKRAVPEKANTLSSAFVHASDDEEDEERDALFFQRELEQRQRNFERNGGAPYDTATQGTQASLSQGDVSQESLEGTPKPSLPASPSSPAEASQVTAAREGTESPATLAETLESEGNDSDEDDMFVK